MMMLRNLLIVMVAGLVLFSCSKDDRVDTTTDPDMMMEPDEVEIVITADDWSIDLDENPESGWILGAINPSVNEGALTYKLVEESAPGAFFVQGDTAAIIIADATLWDFEVNPVLTGTVRFVAGHVTKDVIVTINLQDVDESRLVESAIGYYSFDDGLRNDNASYAYATVGDSLNPVAKGDGFANNAWLDRFGHRPSVMTAINWIEGMQIPTWNRSDLGTEHSGQFTIAFWVQFNNLNSEFTLPLWELNCGLTPAIALFFDNKSSERKDQLYIRQQEPGGVGASGAIKVLDTDKIVRVEQGVEHSFVSEWIYIAMSYDWSTASMKMIIKGEGDNSAVDYSYSWTDEQVIYPPHAHSDDTRVMTIGSRECSTTAVHPASYDDFMIFDYALTVEEMLQLREELNEN